MVVHRIPRPPHSRGDASLRALAGSYLPPWSPLALAVFPVLTIYSANLREIAPLELLTACVLALAAAIFAWFALRALDASRERASVGTAWLVIVMFSYSFAEHLVGRLPASWQVFFVPTLLAGGWLALGPLGIAWLHSAKLDLSQLRRMVELFSGSLLVVAVVMNALAVHLSPWLWSLPAAPSLRDTLTPSEVVRLTPPKEPPDIYYLVFDRYADAKTLADHFQYDNRPFLSDLRQRGFVVAEHSRTNYPKTEISMASALNLGLFDDTVWPKFRYTEMLRDHRVGALLTESGYRYHHLGNLHDGLRWNRRAAENYRFSPIPTELGENLIRLTPAWPFLESHSPREQELAKFSYVAEVAQARGPEPKFIYAHFMLPHEPWKFDERGREPSELEVARRGESQSYARQLLFTNRMILKMVDAVLAASERTPIIVIQADEGPELRYEHDSELSDRAKTRKRCGILSALLLPDRPAAEIVPRDLTPVNTFRLIFREYFAADLPPLPDRSFYFEPANRYGKPDLAQPCRFVDVTALVRDSDPRAP